MLLAQHFTILKTTTFDMPENHASKTGTLYIVATPIGNFEDISPRAVRTLNEVSLIAAESKLSAKKLLSRIGCPTPFTLYNEHSTQQQRQQLIQHLLSGQHLALTSDAGTPLLSDPGYRLVEQAINAGILLVPIPGSSAISACLSIAGLPTDRFIFHGFAPRQKSQRIEWANTLAQESATHVVFESSQRLLALTTTLLEQLEPERRIVLCQELTKMHERITRCKLQDMVLKLQQDQIDLRGESVLVIEGCQTAITTNDQTARILKSLLDLCPPAEAARRAAELTGQPRRKLYALALSLTDATSANALKKEQGS